MATLTATTVQAQAASLRAVTYRLSITPSQNLPRVASQIAGQLWNCKDLLSSTADTAKQGNDTSVIVHRFKTQLSTLLQDRAVEGRWSGVVLVKAAIEAGGVEVLSKSNAWVRNLLGILKKNDPPTTRSLATVTLTRIFMLTWDYSNLVREITTPALPSFVSSCLSNIENNKCSASELQTVLQAFVVLVPRHPTIFRTNESQLRSLLLKIISSTAVHSTQNLHFTTTHVQVSERLLALLHHCSPKQGDANKWDETLKATVTSAHTICDRIFRSVTEQWKSAAGVQPTAASDVILRGEVEADSEDALGLSGWKGIFAGSERLVSLLYLLASHIHSATAGGVTVRIGLIVDLLTRLLSIRIPLGKESALPSNPQISKDEREAMFAMLPGIHIGALKLFQTLMRRFRSAISSIVQPMSTEIYWVFAAEASDVELRKVVYTTFGLLLKLHGHSLAKEDMADIEGIMRACCGDLLPTDATPPRSGVATPNGPLSRASTNGNDLSTSVTKCNPSNPTSRRALSTAAEALLTSFLSNVNPTIAPGRLRTLLERTAVLTRHKDALVAGVLNPASESTKNGTRASLLPLLARLFPDAAEVEALLRPRMPVVRSDKVQSGDDGLGSDTDYQDYPNGADVDGDHGLEHYVNETEPTDGLLNALGQNDTGADSENLYTASPPRNAASAFANAATATEAEASGKRTANGDADAARSAKRLRASPVAETLLPSTDDTLPGVDPATAASGLPATVLTEEPQSSFVTAPEMSQQAVTLSAVPVKASAGATFADSIDMGSDESDFEMPTLTMEQDTESEDEDEEEDGAIMADL